jgi:hypothetical protein
MTFFVAVVYAHRPRLILVPIYQRNVRVKCKSPVLSKPSSKAGLQTSNSTRHSNTRVEMPNFSRRHQDVRYCHQDFHTVG